MSEQYPGKYIVIEGIDGAGTTTQRDLLVQALHQNGKPAVAVAEPGGTPIGEALRTIIKDEKLERMPESSLGMFTIARAELAEQVIRPALINGTNVVSDRNWISSYAYQGYGEGLDTVLIESNSYDALQDLYRPDVRILLDVPIAVAQQRMANRGGVAADYFESKGPAFFERVREGYLQVASLYYYTVIDGEKSRASIHNEIANMLGVAALILDKE